MGRQGVNLHPCPGCIPTIRAWRAAGVRDLGARRGQACIIDNGPKVLVDRDVANDITVIHRPGHLAGFRR
jgi:hypothetical protein